MDQVHKALRASIRKWRRIAYYGGEDEGERNCALCHLFHDHDCYGCPIAEETGERFCRGTPYRDWIRHFEDTHPDFWPSEPFYVICNECERIAKEEVKFLRKLERKLYGNA